MLKYKNVKFVDCRDLDEVINESIPMEYATWNTLNRLLVEGGNGSCWQETVKKRTLDADEVSGLKEMQEEWSCDKYDRNNYPPVDFETIMTHLANIDAIEEGEYVIHLWW